MKLGASSIALAAAGLMTLSPTPAHACGGTFCDTGPTAMPVDQRGENILFVVGGGTVEAHIQIQYEGDPERFAWVLPLPAVPDRVDIGSQILFQNLLAATVPRVGFGGCATATINGGGGGSLAPAPAEPVVEILLQQAVGAFDVTVLSGNSGAEVTTWLTDNGYELMPEAPPILDRYVARGFVFAAVKLTSGTGTDEIHPIVVEYNDTGLGACVPLELTAVAAIEDMRVRTFFLGQRRVVPTNYAHVEPNPVRLDYMNFGANYVDVVSGAVDEAEGQAFVTEYAGPSNVVGRAGIYSVEWDPQAFLPLSPVEVMDALMAQGLAECGGGTCTFAHPLVRPLLEQYVPAPPGVDADGFYSCLPCYEDQIDVAAWNGQGFARDFLERIVTPGRNAALLLDEYPYLTRLFTTISPDEMTLDPLFTPRDDLPDFNGSYLTQCGGGSGAGVLLADGTEVLLSEDGSWPAFDETMPWARTITRFSDDVSAPVVVDNQAAIDEALAVWNGPLEGEPEPIDSVPGIGGSSGTGGASGAAGVGSGVGGNGDMLGADQRDDVSEPSGAGCGCRMSTTTPPHTNMGALFVTALGIAWRRRRKTVALSR